MAVQTAPLAYTEVSRHIRAETRKLLLDGWLTDPTKVCEMGSRGDGTILLSIASRRPGHARHACTVHPVTLEATCDALCPGWARFHHCCHCLLAQCLISGAAWEWVMGFTVEEVDMA